MTRILTLPARLLFFPFRLAAVSARVGWRSGRLVGASRALFFGLGFTTGVLVVSPRARRIALTGVSKVTVAVAKKRDATKAPPTEVVATVPGDGAVLN